MISRLLAIIPRLLAIIPRLLPTDLTRQMMMTRSRRSPATTDTTTTVTWDTEPAATASYWR